jgi:hypothetical protein
MIAAAKAYRPLAKTVHGFCRRIPDEIDPTQTIVTGLSCFRAKSIVAAIAENN